MYQLLYTRKPLVNLRRLKDCNFAISSLLMVGMTMILYGSSVVMPQLAQQELGYTATWSGPVLSLRAVLIIISIPLALKLMPIVQTRWLMAFSFTLMTLSFIYSSHLVRNIDFSTMVKMRDAQSIGLSFLFVLLITLTFITLATRLNTDGSALFAIFRNVAVSISISLSTAVITQRSQAHSTYMVHNMSPFNQQFQQAIQRATQAFLDKSSLTTSLVTGQLYQQMVTQSRILVYVDVFSLCALVLLILIP